MNTRTIEPRKSTTEPLVEIALTADGKDGSFVPIGRRFSAVPHANGLNSYGLTEIENVAFQNARDRLLGLPDQHYPDPTLDAALVAAGLGAGANDAKRQAFVADYRAKNPLPTSFASLPFGDPCNNLEPVPDAPVATIADGNAGLPPHLAVLTVAAPATPAIAHVEDLAPAVQVAAISLMPNGAASEYIVRSTDTATHVTAPVTHIDFLHGLLEAIEPSAEAAVQQLALNAFQAAFRKVFPKAA